jgi:hypothetical protein
MPRSYPMDELVLFRMRILWMYVIRPLHLREVSLSRRMWGCGRKKAWEEEQKSTISRKKFHRSLSFLSASPVEPSSSQIEPGSLKNRGCIQKFPDWLPAARTANGTAISHYVQFYRYFVSQSSEFCRHSPLRCFLTSVYCYKLIFRYDLVRELLDTPINMPNGLPLHSVRVSSM